jgi:hypothetical protein
MGLEQRLEVARLGLGRQIENGQLGCRFCWLSLSGRCCGPLCPWLGRFSCLPSRFSSLLPGQTSGLQLLKTLCPLLCSCLGVLLLFFAISGLCLSRGLGGFDCFSACSGFPGSSSRSYMSRSGMFSRWRCGISLEWRRVLADRSSSSWRANPLSSSTCCIWTISRWIRRYML